MIRKISMTKQALKAIESLPPKQYKQVVGSIIDLAANPTPPDSEHLHGAKNGERRRDVGEYRVVYTHNEETLNCLVVGKRNDDAVYEIWKRLK